MKCNCPDSRKYRANRSRQGNKFNNKGTPVKAIKTEGEGTGSTFMGTGESSESSKISSG